MELWDLVDYKVSQFHTLTSFDYATLYVIIKMLIPCPAEVKHAQSIFCVSLKGNNSNHLHPLSISVSETGAVCSLKLMSADGVHFLTKTAVFLIVCFM